MLIRLTFSHWGGVQMLVRLTFSHWGGVQMLVRLTFSRWGGVQMLIRLTFGSIKLNEEDAASQVEEERGAGIEPTHPTELGRHVEVFGCE